MVMLIGSTSEALKSWHHGGRRISYFDTCQSALNRMMYITSNQYILKQWIVFFACSDCATERSYSCYFKNIVQTDVEFPVGFTLTFTWRPRVFAWVNPLLTYLTAPIRARAWVPLWISKSFNVLMCQYSEWNEKRRIIRPKPKLLSSSCVVLNWKKFSFIRRCHIYSESGIIFDRSTISNPDPISGRPGTSN